MPVPRLRVFAVPNGSGKSTIKHILAPELIYTYVHADDLEREAKEGGEIDLTPFAINCSQDEFRVFFLAASACGARKKSGTQRSPRVCR